MLRLATFFFLHPVPPEADVVEGVFELHPAVRQPFLAGVAFGGRMDRDEPTLQGVLDEQVTGPEFALDEYEIAGGGLFVEPGEHRSQPRQQPLLGRWHVGPA